MRKATRRHLLVGATVPFVLVATAYGCKDYLTEAGKPLGVLDVATLSTRTGVEGSLIATYRAIEANGAVGGWYNAASNWTWSDIPSDDSYKGSEAADQPPMNDIEFYSWATGGVEGELNGRWRGLYEGVARANATLRLLKEVQASKPQEIAAADARGIEGEALFLRAHFHFEAYRLWGNIPYFREADQEYRKENQPSAAVIGEIIKDLDAAIAALPTSHRNGQRGRVTQWTAKAYKGRVQMYAGQFAAARTTLADVRAGGPYKLEQSFDRVWTGFQDFANGPETIFAYQASVNDGEPNGENGNPGQRLNFPHSGSPFGCCGFQQPTQNLVNFFAVDAQGLPIALSNPAWNARNENLTAQASANMTVDPRLDWTVGRDGVPYKDWGTHNAGWIRAPAYGGPYSPKKHVQEKASGSQSTVGWNPQHLNGVNIHIYRYADALLLLAEAEVEAGSLETARQIVNEIRARAAQTAQGPGADRATMAVPINDPRITWAQYRVAQYPAGSAAFANQAAARNAVRTERRLELALEGQRFFDLRRWGIMEDVLNNYITVEKARRPYLAAAAQVTSRHRLYPIPNIQIQLSRVNGNATLTQNPGW
jgi:hypothetical protein